MSKRRNKIPYVKRLLNPYFNQGIEDKGEIIDKIDNGK